MVFKDIVPFLMMSMYIVVNKSVNTHFFVFCASLILLMQYADLREAPFLGHLAVMRKVTGSSPTQATDWKTLTVHPAANGYLINFREG